MSAPVLTGEAKKAVTYRGGHLQIVAAAGAGKTEVVSQRVASLLAEGVRPEQIVAFTFTERAAASLKDRIAQRVVEQEGEPARDRLSRLFVGTIHAYCFRLLQAYVPAYEAYDVLDDNQLTAFLTREAYRLGIKQLDSRHRLFASIQRFRSDIDIVENERLKLSKLPEPFRTVAQDYYAALEKYRLLTYGQMIDRAVEELGRKAVAAKVHADIRHLIVDEYQDVNPAQEALIRRMTGPQTTLCVVGDDDQAIYQWRGSTVRNIIEFDKNYPNVKRFNVSTNWRSRPTIIATANKFATTIPERLDKRMKPDRADAPPEVTVWHAEYEDGEADRIAETIQTLHRKGAAYRDIAILVRSRTAYPALLRALEDHGVPVQPGDRTGLFDRPEARTLGMTYCWLVDHDWNDAGWGYNPVTVDDQVLAAEYAASFRLSSRQVKKVMALLDAWKVEVTQTGKPVDLLRDFYDLLTALDAKAWALDDPLAVNRLGTLARFSSLLADYESVRRRARPDDAEPGQQVGGEDRGEWYYKNLAIHISNYAVGAYEGFEGEPDSTIDAVDLTTVHRAKGLEWPFVFVPSLTKNRFPSSKTGKPDPGCNVPVKLFDAPRYWGTIADERRLFYVAITRARDWVSVSRHDRPNKSIVAASPFFLDLTAQHKDAPKPALPPVARRTAGESDPALTLSFSDLAAYDRCGLAYRLRNLMGFQPSLAPELGYGKAVHHVLRTVAEHTSATGSVPTEKEITRILDSDFYLPAANKPAHKQMKEAAKRLVTDYVTNHSDELHRIWETERPFELHIGGAIISGRADVILDREGGVESALAIVDYKTSTDQHGDHDLQLQIYSDAGRRENLDVRAAYVHDLKAGKAIPVDVSDAQISRAEAHVEGLVDGIRKREYPARAGAQCGHCDVRALCGSRKA